MGWKLVDETTGVDIPRGAKRTLRDGECVTIVGFDPPHKPSASGRVHITFDDDPALIRTYYCSVIGGKYVWGEDWRSPEETEAVEALSALFSAIDDLPEPVNKLFCLYVASMFQKYVDAGFDSGVMTDLMEAEELERCAK
jgi:hypothetical protein